jgi:hypothetical protein
MVYTAKPGQVSYGEAIGIVLIENYAPFIPGDTANATTYDYPVRFCPVKGVTPERLFVHDPQLLPLLAEAVEELQLAGVRAVTGDCGFLAAYQEELSARFAVPLFLSSLMQIPFISSIIGRKRKIGIVTANAGALTDEVFTGIGISPDLQNRTAVIGLEDSEHFVSAVFEENGFLDSSIVERDVVERAVRLKNRHPELGAILLECSLLPPYGRAVYQATNLPVFDYITMIDYVCSAVVKKRYTGEM